MKFQKNLEDFWLWFAESARGIQADPMNGQLIAELDNWMRLLDKRLTWEIGPDRSGSWSFTVSPNHASEMIPIAEEVIRAAPALIGWKFYSRKQPKLWNRRFEVTTKSGAMLVDASRWQFVLLQYDDGATEIVVCGEGLEGIDEPDRDKILTTVLEGELGEKILMDPQLFYEFVPEVEDYLLPSLRDLSQIRSAFGVE